MRLGQRKVRLETRGPDALVEWAWSDNSNGEGEGIDLDADDLKWVREILWFLFSVFRCIIIKFIKKSRLEEGFGQGRKCTFLDVLTLRGLKALPQGYYS